MEAVSADAIAVGLRPEQQTMKLDRVFWSHFSPNLGPGGWVAGVLLVHLGLDLKFGVLAILIGNLVGGLPVALAATIGPPTGLPQMEASRRALGRDGVRLPSLLNWIYCVGWDAVNNVPAAAALIALLALAGTGVPFWLALALLAGVQMIASIYGHDVVQSLQKYLGAVLLVAFAAAGVLCLLHDHAAGVPSPPSLPNFVLATAILASFNLSWASYASDYTRYLPAATPPRRIVTRAFLGLVGAAAPFQLLGLLTAGSMADATPLAVIAGLQQAAGLFAPVVLAALALSSITGNSVNDNTASYSLISAGLHVPRVLAAILTASLGYALAVLGAGHYTDLYASYLVLTLYWIAPWTGIVLADWYCRPGPRRDAAQRWTVGASLFVVVSVATILLFSVSDVYTGIVARWLGGADVGYYVGFLAAFVGYAVWAPGERKRFFFEKKNQKTFVR